MILWLVVILGLYSLLNFFQQAVSSPGSDHYYHLALINSIRANKNRFVSEIDSILGQKYFSYPQGFHWILSHFSKTAILRRYNFIGILIGLLSLCVVLVFFYSIYPFLDLAELSIERFILFTGVLYVTTPFSYAIWNAKNVGISARGIGLFLGIAYVYCLIFFQLDLNYYYLFAAFFISSAILLSSQFGNQFVLFFSVIFGIYFQNVLVILTPLCSIFIFILFNKKVAKSFLKGQYWHKRIYFENRNQMSILTSRYSIWRDLIWDIWIRLKRPLVFIEYFLKNSFISVLLAIPYVAILSYFLIFNKEIFTLHIFQDGIFTILFVSSLIPLVLFVLTSFRITRFLGEPERYVEFLIPVYVVLLVVMFENNPNSIFLLIGWNILFTFVQMSGSILKSFLVKMTKSNPVKQEHIWNEAVETMNSYLEDGKNRVFSNSLQLTKHFMGGNAKILFPTIAYPYTGRYHFSEIFPRDYSTIDKDVIPGLLKDFSIDWLLFDSNLDQTHNLENWPFLKKEKELNGNITICSVNLEMIKNV